MTEPVVDNNLFFLDKGEFAKIQDNNATSFSDSGDNEKPVWYDSDDEQTKVDLTKSNRTKKLRKFQGESFVSGKEYSKRLRQHYEHMHPTPKWAQHEISDNDSENAHMNDPFEILRSKNPSNVTPLLPDVIGIKRERNANFMAKSTKEVVSVQYHPCLPLILVVCKDRRINVFENDNKKNALLYTLKIQDWNILDAKFNMAGDKVIICGEGKSLIVWNMRQQVVQRINSINGRGEKSWKALNISTCGKYISLIGNDSNAIVIISAHTLQYLFCLKMSGVAVATCFSADGRFLYSVGTDNHLYCWSLSDEFCCLFKIPEKSGTQCTSLAISSDNQLIAVGSNLGILSIYQVGRLEKNHTEPLKSLTNLTTRISSIKFHPSSELLAFASDEKKNSFRLVHLKSGKVYANWPKSNSPLSCVQKIDFNPNGKTFSIGNDKGQILSYSLDHYNST